MKRFQFRLERILRLRHLMVGEKKRDLMALISQRNEMEGRRDEAHRLLGESEAKEVTVEAFLLDAAFKVRMKAEVEQLNINLEMLKPELEKALQAYREAQKEARSIELLKEKQQAEHQYEVERTLQIELDERGQRRKVLM